LDLGGGHVLEFVLAPNLIGQTQYSHLITKRSYCTRAMPLVCIIAAMK